MCACVCLFYPHLSESSRRRRPALVQHVLGQVPAQRHEEGVAHIIQEILVLRAALLVAVDEAFDEPEDETMKGIKRREYKTYTYNHCFKTTCQHTLAF